MPDQDWAEKRAANLRNWEERVAIHLASPFYAMDHHFAGRGQLAPIEAAEVGEVTGLSVLHSQCHFGRDSIALAQMGAKEVLGLDFSPEALAAARDLTAQCGLSDRVRFLECDIMQARPLVPEAAFDLVYVTWGTIGWLHDIKEWARLVAHALKPGGRLYFADGHPAMLVFDDEAALPDGMPGYFIPYFDNTGYAFDDEGDYADPEARLANSRTYDWLHTTASIVTALGEAGLKLDFLHEHDSLPWAAFSCLVKDEQDMFHWPDKRWLPLGLSLGATKLA